MADEQKMEEVDLLDVLLDENNKEPIVFMDEQGKKLAFEQVAVIPYEVRKETRLYCVLKPIDKIDGVNDDEAIVFLVDTDEDGNSVIKVEEDEEIAIAVFDKYYDLLEESQKEEKKTAKKATKAAEKKPAEKKPAEKKETTKKAGKKAE